MPVSPQAWARGYARQAKADFGVFDLLSDPRKALYADRKEIAACQSLHFLQMACEKLCKAHLCGRGTDPEVLQASHAFIAGTLPVIAQEEYARLGGKRLRSRSGQLRLIRQLAREIELLAPTVDDGGRRPDNCEYPWEDAGGLHVPADYSFPNLNLLTAPGGRLLLKLIPSAIDAFLERTDPE